MTAQTRTRWMKAWSRFIWLGAGGMGGKAEVNSGHRVKGMLTQEAAQSPR